MMDADHDLDTESVTEMSQMISSLIEDGHYTDLVVSLYSDIGNIAINNPKIEKYISAAKSGNTAIIKELLGKSDKMSNNPFSNPFILKLSSIFILASDCQS